MGHTNKGRYYRTAKALVFADPRYTLYCWSGGSPQKKPPQTGMPVEGQGDQGRLFLRNFYALEWYTPTEADWRRNLYKWD